MGIIEPGSLDLDQVNLRIGGIKTDDRNSLNEGNKFVVVEHFVDREGNPLEARQFDVSSMCYSLFVSPEHSISGRHSGVLRHHNSTEQKGMIVGGGLLKVSPDGAFLCQYSGDFDTEPLRIREKFGALLLPELKKILGQEIPSLNCDVHISHTNTYWLRFRQILEDVKNFYIALGRPQAADRMIARYVHEEKERVRDQNS